MLRASRRYSRAVCVFGLIALGACSTVVEGSDQPMTITTEPSGAECSLTRDGATVGAVAQTPGSLVVSKSKDDLTLSCSRANYLVTEETVESGTSGWSAGNILFGLLGGGIGLVVDSASGAMNKYPETVLLVMTPDSFASEEEKSAFFDRRVADVDAKYDAARTEIEGQCRSRPSDLCTSKLEKLEAARQTKVDRIETQRSQAVVAEP